MSADDAQVLPLKTLILICEPKDMDPNDFVNIGREILSQASDVDVNIIGPNFTAAEVKSEKWSRPSLTISFVSTGSFVPLRGPILQNTPIKKLDQFHRFEAADIPTPKTQKLKLSSRFSPEDWGEFVVLKPLPLTMTSTGDMIRLMRTRRLDTLTRSGEISRLLPRGAPVLVQQFIDTGPLPTHWRLLTLFGRTLYSMKFWNPSPRPDLASDDALIESAIIETKHPDLKKKYRMKDMRTLEHKPEMLELAARTHSAFPNIPLQGVDILEEWGTSRLYVIEINAGGNTWHFSSSRSKIGRIGGITRNERIGQFGAWRVAAEALIETTRRFAG
jgi:hypothetical protein